MTKRQLLAHHGCSEVSQPYANGYWAGYHRKAHATLRRLSNRDWNDYHTGYCDGKAGRWCDEQK